MSLTLEQCQSIVKRKNAGMLSAEIAKKYDMPLYHDIDNEVPAQPIPIKRVFVD